MSRKVLISAAVAAWLVIFLPVGYCLAQSGNLQRVVVTDRFEKLPLTIEEKAQPTVIQQFDSVDIENSAAEVLSDFLAEKGIGVYKSPTDQGHTLTTIRGFRTDHLSKELDGRVLFLVNGHRTGTANSTQIPLLNVERVEILRGPEMLRYSGASPGGVINVVTKKGGPDKLDGSVEVGYGSAETFKAQGKLGGMVNNFDYSLGYGFYKKGDYKDGNGRKVLHTGVAANHSLMAEIGYSFNDNHRISWSTYLYYVDKAERPAYVDPTDINAALYASDTVAYRHNFNHTLNYDGSYDKWDWNLSFTYGENLNEVYQSNEHMPGVYPMASSFDRTLGQASVTYSGDIFTITGGVDYLNYITGEGASTSVSNGQIANPGKPLITTGEFENLAGYLVGNVRLLEEKLIFSGGLRYDYYKVSDRRFGAEDYGFTQPSSRLKSDPTKYGYDRFATSQTYSRLSPSLGVSYLPLEFLKLRANWTHSFRPPSPRELFSSWYESYGFSGYPWNKAENTDSYEFGFDLNDKYFSFSATYFFSHTKDYVYQHEDPIQDIRRVRNTDKQRRSGIEVSFNGNVAGALGYTNIEVRPYFYLSYLFKTEELYREGRQDILGRWVNTYSSWIPKSTANYGLLVRVPSIKLTTNLNFSYWGNVYPSTVTLFTQGAYNPDLSYPSFTIVNFSLRKGLIDFGDKGNLELKLDATNIFDKLYNYGDPNPATNPIYMPGRSFYAGLVYNF